MHGETYQPRMLHIERDDELAGELKLIGVIDPGMHRMMPKTRCYTLKLSNVSAPLAHVLKEVFLSVGGDAAVSRDIMTYEIGHTDVILIGSRKQFSNAAKGLMYETELGGPDIAAEIESAIAIYEAGPVLPGDDELPDPKARLMFDRMQDRTLIMGILNVTPDSFSDGGRFLDHEAAVRRGVQMVEEGADIIDVGGESTRPGSEPVPTEDEMGRVVPVIRELSWRVDVPISIDSYKSATVEAALDAGASIVNDISGMSFDQGMPALAAERKCPVILMHIKGTPRDMQINPTYEDLMGEITAYLRERIRVAIEAGLPERLLIVDPGIGFGKTAPQNLEILRRLREFKSLGRPILVGTSRKSTIGHVLGGLPADERLEGTAATVTLSIAAGANIIRVHDVKEMALVAKMTDAVLGIRVQG